MEWVTTTGKTVEEAKEAALDELGVDASEAEFEILEEPKSSFFKLSRSDARVRARVLPKTPRPKQERRTRRGRGRKGRSGSEQQRTSPDETTTTEATETAASPAAATTNDDAETSQSGGRRRRNRSRGRSGSGSGAGSADKKEGTNMSDDPVSVDEQADIIGEFLEGLLGAIEVRGDIARNKIDDDTIEFDIEGDQELGLLIGPKGQTLTAVHELSRTVLQRKATGRHDGRVRIDIGGYRKRRAEALARFVTQQADAVKAEGVARALEPMNAADRKIVHDTVNEIDGLGTISEGADPRRRVVIVLEADQG